MRVLIILLTFLSCSCSFWGLPMPEKFENLYSTSSKCTEVAIRNAFTFLDEGYPTLIAVGPTKKKGIGHAQALALKGGRMVPIINSNENKAILSERGDVDENNDPVLLGRDYLLSPREAIKLWYPVYGID